MLTPGSTHFKTIAKFAEKAIRLAKSAAKMDEVPVAAIIIQDGKLLAAGVNRISRSKDPTAHAELIAIQRAAKRLNNERLLDCELITTLEPCSMCTGAAVLARVKRIYYCAAESKYAGSEKILSNFQFNHKPELVQLDHLQPVAAELLTGFFSKRRKK